MSDHKPDCQWKGIFFHLQNIDYHKLTIKENGLQYYDDESGEDTNINFSFCPCCGCEIKLDQIDNLDFEELKRKLYAEMGTKRYWHEEIRSIIHEMVRGHSLSFNENDIVDVFVELGILIKVEHPEMKSGPCLDMMIQGSQYRAPNFKM